MTQVLHGICQIWNLSMDLGRMAWHVVKQAQRLKAFEEKVRQFLLIAKQVID